MGLHAETIADFYQQLALLIESNLPLPASLRELARQPLDAGFQQALVKLAERTDKGVPSPRRSRPARSTSRPTRSNCSPPPNGPARWRQGCSTWRGMRNCRPG